MEQSKSILIVEDEFSIALDLQERLTKMGFNNIRVCLNYEDALTEIIQETPHIALLDINLGAGRGGLDLAKLIKYKWGFPIVFISAFATDDIINLALDCCPSAYITKPFKDIDVKNSIIIALNQLKSKKKEASELRPINNTIFVKDKSGMMPIKTDEILWIKAMDNYITIHTKDKKYTINTLLKDIMDKLDHNFIRIHRSHVVAINKISRIDGNYLYINDIPLAISESYKKELMECLKII